MTNGEGVLDFEWKVSTGGYRWVMARARQNKRGERLPFLALPEGDSLRDESGAILRRILIPAQLLDNNDRLIRPLDGGLHRVLAAVEPSEAGIIHFANQYGTLGLERQDVDVTRLLQLPLIAFFPADSFEDWRTEIEDLRTAVGLWDAKEGADDVRTNLNRIADLIKPRVADLLGNPVPREDGRGLRMRFSPKSLCAAAWLQFEQETEGYFDLLQCPECGQWFKYFPEQIKTPRVFCSQACRSKAYRKRQQQARRLYADGVPVSEITERLRSDPETISRWLSSG